jgi:hypothetical protein
MVNGGVTTITDNAVTTAKIKNGEIINEDISATAAIVDTKLATIATTGKVSNSATTATELNTASTIVARDANGDFIAGTITAELNGNAATVTTNAGLTGDVTSTGNATTVKKINGTSLAGLANGILKNTTGTGVPSIAVAADFPILNQSTTGSAATFTTARAIYGNNFDGSASLTGIIASTYGGTGNGFTKFSGPTSSEKTFTLPDSNATLARTDAAQTFTGSQTFSSIIEGSVTGNAATVTNGIYTTSKISDLSSTTSAELAGKISDETGMGTLVFATSPTLVTPTLGVATANSVNKVTITAPATGSILTIADGKTLTTSNSITLAGTDATTMTFPSTNATIARTDAAQTFTGTQTFSSTIAGSVTGNAATVTTNANLTGPITSSGNATSIASQTGTGTKFVMDTSPTLVTPVIGVATGTSLSVSGQLTSTVATGTAPLVVSSTTAVANLSIGGNAATVTKLATARKINTVDFDGSGDITVTAAAGTLTGATLASNVLSSSLTSVGTIATGTWNGTTIAIANGGTGATSATAAFDALSPMTTKGDVIYGGDSGTGTRLAKGADGQVLTLASGVPTWASGVSTISSKAVSYTLTTSDNYVIASSGSGITFTLPTAVGNTGKEFTIKNISSSNVTIATTSSQTIVVDAANSSAITATLGVEASNNWIRVISDGAKWIAFRALF